MPSPKPIPEQLLRDGEQFMRICNACRYCEGFCAVFPAMERRISFAEEDLNFLANLCHECGECFYSCPYAPPHEFRLNLPQTLAQIRVETYKKYAWPNLFAGFFRSNGIAVGVIAAFSVILFLVALLFRTEASVFFSPHADAEGSFYAIMSHRLMVAVFGLVSLFVIAAMAGEWMSFWRDTGKTMHASASFAAFWDAAADALRLRYLDGGGEGCAYPSEVPSQARRWFHHLTFYGFALCFAATTVAAIYHYFFRWEAPYPFLSLPVVLGTLGGIGLLIGPAGLLWLKGKRNAELVDQKQTGMDLSFLLLLLLTSITGFLLLVFRESPAMGVLLAVHLGIVLALFVTLPYGKFVHAIYRFAALMRNAAEKRRAISPARLE